MNWIKLKNNSWFQGIVCSLAASALWAIGSFFNTTLIGKILSFEITMPIWSILAIALFALFVYEFYNKKRKSMYPFLNETVLKQPISNIIWTWEWVFDSKDKKYKINNFSPLCPHCGGLMSYIYMNYKCGKCGSDIDSSHFNTIASRKQVISDLKNKFPKYKDIISFEYLEN